METRSKKTDVTRKGCDNQKCNTILCSCGESCSGNNCNCGCNCCE